ncbi:MAG: SDR family oxidoreductase [Polyangiaceae bacterium]|nr:SDR family oxidoreductase [Polyangiaceae bacterium]
MRERSRPCPQRRALDAQPNARERDRPARAEEPRRRGHQDARGKGPRHHPAHRSRCGVRLDLAGRVPGRSGRSGQRAVRDPDRPAGRSSHVPKAQPISLRRERRRVHCDPRRGGARGRVVTDERVILVTGARKGVGKALALHYAREGARVVGLSRTEPDWTDERVEHLLGDVSKEDDVVRAISHVKARYGRLDVALNNAGIASMNHALLMPGRTAQRIVDTNFMGTYLVCREAARVMMRRKFGRIVNFSTVAVPLGLEGELAYAASKSAVESLTRILAKEVATYGITVNAVGLTPTDTDLIKNVPKEKIDGILRRLAIGRLGTIEDALWAVDFFISGNSGYITGQTLYLGGP